MDNPLPTASLPPWGVSTAAMGGEENTLRNAEWQRRLADAAIDMGVRSYPDSNPKTLVGAKKVPLHLVPPSAKHFLALALENGATKYGSYNYRDLAISISTYKAAAERHMDAFWDGEDLAEDSGVHHVAHAMACCALILDAMTIGKLVDDRPTKGASAALQKEYYEKEKA